MRLRHYTLYIDELKLIRLHVRTLLGTLQHMGASERTAEELFAAAVRRYREELGISQGELARRMTAQGYAWHQTTVARTESGDRPARLGEAVALSAILRFSLDTLTHETSDAAARADHEYRAALTERENTARLLADAQIRLQLATTETDNIRREAAWANEVFEQARARLDAENQKLVRATIDQELAAFEVETLTRKFNELEQAIQQSPPAQEPEQPPTS